MSILVLSPVNLKDKAIFSRQLAATLDAGVPPNRCFALLTKECPNPKLKKALGQISVEVKQGRHLWEAMGKHSDCFDELYITMVKVGETGGVLPQVLNHLATLMEESALQQNKLKSALFSLGLVGVVAIATFIGMSVFVVPSFAKVFAEMGTDLPPLTSFVLACSEFLRNFWKVGTLILLIMAIAIAYKSYYKTPEGRVNLDRAKLKLPILGEQIKKTVVSRFCFVLGILIGAGVPILTAWEMAREAVGNKAIAKSLKAAQNDIRLGNQMSISLQKQRIFPANVIQTISIAEEAGEIDTMLMKMGALYENEVEQAIKTIAILGWIVVGGIVGLILLAMYLPMFAVYEKIG